MSSLLISSMAVCDLLITTSFYLTDSSTLDHIPWAVDGRKTVLFEMPKDPSTDSKMEPAIISTIIVLSEQGSFLTSDGNWCGPSEITPHLSDAKGSCIGMAPRVNPFHDNFSSLLEHARALQGQAALHEEAASIGFVCNNCIKFQHVLFQVCYFSLYWFIDA